MQGSFGFPAFTMIDKISKITLIVGVMLCGVVSNPYAIDPSLVIRHIVWCITTLVLCSCLCLQKRKNLSILQAPIFVIFVIYGLMTTVSIFGAVNKSESLYYVLVAWVSLIFFVCVAAKIDKKSIIKAMVYMGLIFAVYGLYDVTKAAMDKGITSTFGLGFANGRNLWSSAILLLLPFSLYAVFKNKSKIAMFVSVLLIINIILLQTRSVYAGLIVASCVCFFSWKKWAIVWLVIITVVCVSSFDRLQATGSLNYRLQSWSRTIRVFCDEPIMGVGAGNWKIATPRYGNTFIKDDGSSTRQHHQRAHNDFLEVLTETGLLGGLSYIAIFACGLYYTYRSRDRVLAWTMRFGIISYMVFAFFSFPKERALHSMILFIMIALVVKNSNAKKVWVGRNIKTLVICIVVLFSALFVNYQRSQTEVYSKKVMIAKSQFHWMDVISLIDHNYSPYATMVGYSVTPIYYYRGEANFYIGDHGEALNDFEKADQLHPNHSSTLFNIGYYNEGQKEYERALHYYARAEKIFPADFISAAADRVEKMIEK